VGALRSLPGVRGVDTLAYVQVARDVVGPVGEAMVMPDAVDRALLRALQDDGRLSFVELGARAGISPASARRRVLRLIDGQAVRVGAVIRHSGQDRQIATGVGLRLHSTGNAGLTTAAGWREVIFAAHTLGRFDALLTLRAFSTRQLLDSLDRLRALESVAAVESWTHLQIVKESYASAIGEPA
jgi:DNA-binding Lrp family transcriptional regulator